jgi:hypothetical protein
MKDGMNLKRFLAIWCLAVSLLAATAAIGQNSASGSLVGTVTDSSDAVVSNATVTLKNMGTNGQLTGNRICRPRRIDYG